MSSKNKKQNEEMQNAFTKLVDTFVKLSVHIDKSLNIDAKDLGIKDKNKLLKLIHLIFALGNISKNEVEKRFCLVLGITIYNYIILSKIWIAHSKVKIKKTRKVKSKLKSIKFLKPKSRRVRTLGSVYGGNSPENNDNTDLAIVALASLIAEEQIKSPVISGGGGTALDNFINVAGSRGVVQQIIEGANDAKRARVNTEPSRVNTESTESIMSEIELIRARTAKRIAEAENEDVNDEIQERNKKKEIRRAILEKVSDMIAARVSYGAYLSVIGESAVSSCVCFSLIQATTQISNNIANNVTNAFENVAEAVTPTVIRSMSRDGYQLIQNGWTYLSNMYDAYTYSENYEEQYAAMQEEQIRAADLARAQTIQGGILDTIFTTLQTASRNTDVQISCAVGAIICCCLTIREHRKARHNSELVAHSYLGTSSADFELNQYNSTIRNIMPVAGAVAAGVTGTPLFAATSLLNNSSRRHSQSPSQSQIESLQQQLQILQLQNQLASLQEQSSQGSSGLRRRRGI
jgi:hypothetical protein